MTTELVVVVVVVVAAAGAGANELERDEELWEVVELDEGGLVVEVVVVVVRA
jgi:hypothetical protein